MKSLIIFRALFLSSIERTYVAKVNECSFCWVDYNLIHKECTMFLKELCHFGLKGMGNVLNEKKQFDFQISVSRKHSAKTIKVQPQGTFCYRK